MAVARIAIVYGLGGAAFDPLSGERHLTARLQEIGVNTGESPYQHYDSQKVYNFLKEGVALFFRGIIGDSLGACNAPLFAQNLYPLTVNYIAGFQPSQYGIHCPVPRNVEVAHCIYDPVWMDTFGLGAYCWELAAGNHKTKLLVTQHRGAHPDDWGYSQELVFNEVKGLLK